MDIQEQKKTWRRLMVDTFALLPRDSRRDLDAKLATRFRKAVSGKGGRLILGFAPMPDEPDLSPFFRRWLRAGGLLAMPQWLGGAKLAMRRVDDLDTQLRPGRAGILEPLPDLPPVEPGEVELVATPGRVFSEKCDRLGRGSGCYDALFRSHNPIKVGVGYDFQIFPSLPTYFGDVPLDMVITPSRTVEPS